MQQIRSKLSPEAAAFHSGSQGVGMTGHDSNSINTAAHQRGAQQYRTNQQPMGQNIYR